MSRFFPYPSEDEANSESDSYDSEPSASEVDEWKTGYLAHNHDPRLWNLKAPWSSLCSLRYSLRDKNYSAVSLLTKDLLRFNESKVKEPIRYIIARYLACLRHRLEDLPDRRERRNLASDKARAIVALQSSTFLATLETLEQRWSQQHIPGVLYTDSQVNDMLLKLENTMIARWYPWPDGEPKEIILDWSEKFNHRGLMPLPIIGLEYTLSLYFPTTPVDLSNISTLDLRERNLTVFPQWIRRIQGLRMVWIDGNNILYFPSWMTNHLKIRTLYKYQPASLALDRSPMSLTDYVSIALKRFVDTGGDWTSLMDLPPHLLAKVVQAVPPRQNKTQYIDLEEYERVQTRLNPDADSSTRGLPGV